MIMQKDMVKIITVPFESHADRLNKKRQREVRCRVMAKKVKINRNIGHFSSVALKLQVLSWLVSHLPSVNLLLIFSLCIPSVNFYVVFSLTHLMKWSQRSYISNVKVLSVLFLLFSTFSCLRSCNPLFFFPSTFWSYLSHCFWFTVATWIFFFQTSSLSVPFMYSSCPLSWSHSTLVSLIDASEPSTGMDLVGGWAGTLPSLPFSWCAAESERMRSSHAGCSSDLTAAASQSWCQTTVWGRKQLAAEAFQVPDHFWFEM